MVKLSLSFAEVFRLLGRPVGMARAYSPAHLRPDLIAGFTIALVIIPQFAT